MRKAGGNWVDGDRFFDREAEVEALTERIRDGAHTFDEHQKPVVLAIDELSILVNRLLKGHDYLLTPERIQAADEFLSWLRRVAQEHRNVRLVISGSISLEPILRQAGLSAHANVFSRLELHPWSESTACWRRYR